MASDSHAVLGIGNPLLDISAPVDQAFLDKYGFELNNAILAEEKHMSAYEDLKAMPNVEYIAGGATLNSIRICQWVAQDKPGSTAYIGCIGKDENGKTMTDCVGKDGVAPYFKLSDDTPTGTCAVCIKDKERSLCANLAAANKYDISHLQQPAITKVYENAGIVYIAGFFLTVSLDTILTVGKYAAANNKIFCMNISAPFIPLAFGEQLHKALEYVDFLFGNETEAETYAEANKLEKSVLAAAKHLAALPKANKSRPRQVVITQGASSTVIVTEGKDDITVPVPALEKDKIVDVNGAGDSFVGGFLSQLLQGADLEKCVAQGHAAARYIIQRSGVSFDGKPDF